VPDDRRYTAEHEWALQEADQVVVGITDFAQHELGDVVYVQLPRVGALVAATKEFGVIESVKSASDLFSPLSGEVLAVNDALADHPELVNSSPYDEGWMVRVRPEDPSELDELMDAAGYRALIGG
jgi:glycine cleavage system H protein